jgi:hypothetical protein
MPIQSLTSSLTRVSNVKFARFVKQANQQFSNGQGMWGKFKTLNSALQTLYPSFYLLYGA